MSASDDSTAPAPGPAESDQAEAAANAEQATAEPSWDERAPSWERHVGRFCENWIFAFIIAMAIRHFAIEAYRIPSASMEPMLYGDPRNGDFVVVDKLSARFSSPQRWDVTVFQFPWPEIRRGGRDVVAWGPAGERLDRPFVQPLIHRNFVKRAVVVPGDVFYIAGGDLHLGEQQADGSWAFAAAVKPDEVQEGLWTTVYRHGDQGGYVPWLQGGEPIGFDAAVGLVVTPAASAPVRFSQPLSNLYLKPGTSRVRPNDGFNSAGRLVEVSMTRPQFDYENAGVNQVGNIWDLDRWVVSRLTSNDLDSGSAAVGRDLNTVMGELVGDARVTWTASALTGTVTLRLHEVGISDVALELSAEAWRLVVDGSPVADGTGGVLGAEWSLAHLDDQVLLVRDGTVMTEPVRVAPANAVARPDERLQIDWSGSGSLTLQALRIDRDIHYSQRGILEDYARPWAIYNQPRPIDPNTGSPSGAFAYLFESYRKEPQITGDRNLHQAMVGREQFTQAMLDQADAERRLASLALARTALGSRMGVQLAGGGSQLAPMTEAMDAWLEPLGNSPATALRAPDGAYLLLGDNSPFSWDGRSWGWVPGANLRGEVLAVAWPVARWRVVR